MHIERENPSVLAKVTQVSDVTHGPLILKQYSPMGNNCKRVKKKNIFKKISPEQANQLQLNLVQIVLEYMEI
jgi:hypothetical protein